MPKIEIKRVGGGKPAGNTGEIQFNDSGVFGADSGLFWDNSSKELGIGTNTPSQQLETTKSIEIADTTASDKGVIYKGGNRFLHNFHDPTGGGAVPDGNNVFAVFHVFPGSFFIKFR